MHYKKPIKVLGAKASILLLLKKFPALVRDAFISTLIITLLALIIHDNVSLKGLMLIVIIAYGYGIAFAYNDFRDASIDSSNLHRMNKNVFSTYEVSPKILLVLSLLSALLFVGTGLYYFSFKGAFLALLSLFVAWAYSSPPFRFKSRPGFDVLVHGLFVETYPYILTMLMMGISWTKLDTLIAIGLLVNSISNQLIQQVRDYEFDKKEKMKTTVIMLGASYSKFMLVTINVILVGLITIGFVLFFPSTIYFIILLILLIAFIILRTTNLFVQIYMEIYYKGFLAINLWIVGWLALKQVIF